jgi:hypothetical protein
MQVGCIIGKGGLTVVWYIRSVVVAGCNWAKKPKHRGDWFGVEGTWAGTAGVSGAGGGGGY